MREGKKTLPGNLPVQDSPSSSGADAGCVLSRRVGFSLQLQGSLYIDMLVGEGGACGESLRKLNPVTFGLQGRVRRMLFPRNSPEATLKPSTSIPLLGRGTPPWPP